MRKAQFKRFVGLGVLLFVVVFVVATARATPSVVNLVPAVTESTYANSIGVLAAQHNLVLFNPGVSRFMITGTSFVSTSPPICLETGTNYAAEEVTGFVTLGTGHVVAVTTSPPITATNQRAGITGTGVRHLKVPQA